MTETINQSDPERVSDKRHDNGYCFGRMLCSQGSRRTFNDYYVGVKSEHGTDATFDVLIATVSVPPINYHILALYVPGLLKASTKCRCLLAFVAHAYGNNPDTPGHGLLSFGRKRKG